MKLSKIFVALSAVAVAQGSIAASYDGNLAGFDSETGSKVGSVAIALASNANLRDALQVVEFGPGSACVGNNTKLCMPSLSSAEVRLLLTSSVDADLRAMVNAGNNPAFADYTFTGPQCTSAEERDGDLWEVARCVIGGVKTPFVTRYVPAEAKVAASAFAGAAPCGGSAAIATNGTSASVLATLATLDGSVASERHGFAPVPVTEIAGAPGVGFIKLDGQAPDLANYLSGNYGFGSNVLGAGAAPADSSAAFGTVGVALESAGGASTPYNQNAGLVVGSCESLFVGSIVDE